MIRHSALGMGMVAVILLGLSSVANARLEDPQAHVQVPTEVTGANLVLAFSQRVNLKDTIVEIRNSRGVLVEIGDLRTAKNGTDLKIPLSAPLRPDVYTIHWRAVSIHGVVDEGGYGFQVEPSFNHIPALAQQ